MHQRVSANIDRLLNARLALVKPEWSADREIGVVIPENSRFNPEPDITVIETDFSLGQVYAERFYFVVEDVSPSDRKLVLDLKLEYYQLHQPCFGVMFVRQDRMGAELFLRQAAWAKQDIDDPLARLILPTLGDIGALCDLYRHTPLFEA